VLDRLCNSSFQGHLTHIARRTCTMQTHHCCEIVGDVVYCNVTSICFQVRAQRYRSLVRLSVLRTNFFLRIHRFDSRSDLNVENNQFVEASATAAFDLAAFLIATCCATWPASFINISDKWTALLQAIQGDLYLRLRGYLESMEFAPITERLIWQQAPWRHLSQRCNTCCLVVLQE
jgi:hypothetical protein